MESELIARPNRRTWWLALAGAASFVTVAIVVLGRARDPAPAVRWEEIQAAADSGRWPDAEAGLRLWLRARPDDGEAWDMLGSLLFDAGRDAESLAALSRVKEEDGGWVHARTLMGDLAIRRREAAEAERILRAVVERDRKASEPLRRLVYLLSLEGRTAEARSVLLRLHETTRDPRHLADSILIRWSDDDIREAGPELGEFLERTPEDPWLRRAWGLSRLSRGRPDEALPHLEAAALAFEDDPACRFALAECRMMLGRYDGDLTILGTCPAPAADAALWWLMRGRLQEAGGDLDRAEESFRRSLAADPESQEARFRLGQVLARRGGHAQARPHLERAGEIRLREDALKSKLRQLHGRGPDAGAMEQLGRLCLESGMRVEARAWLEHALRQDPRRKHLRPELAVLARADDDRRVAHSGPTLRPVTPPPPGRSSKASDHGGVPSLAGGRGAVRLEDWAAAASMDFTYASGEDGRLFIADTMGGGVGLIDFDEDGWLDVYFVNGCPLPVDPSSPPRPNRLYRNLGGGTFEDVTERAGVAGRGYGMGCAVGDYDGDGRDDLFVTGLGGTVLYRNRGDGSFEDVTERAGVGSPRWTTAAGFGDLDGDGDLDLVVVTYVEANPVGASECKDDSGRPIHCPPHRFPAQFDQLFRNEGDGTFTDVSREAGIEVPEGRGLGLAIADLDGDGRLDLFVANDGTANFLFRNLGGMRFQESGLDAGVSYDGSGQPTASMGVVADDLNGDGLIDLFHTNFINQSSTLRWNLGGGLFADRTLWANLAAPSRSRTGFGTAAFDADNDGNLDLFVANGHVDDQPWFHSPMAQPAQLFLGREGGRFAIADDEASLYFSRPMVGRGVAAGDLDNDGRVDLVVVHRDAPAAWLRNVTQGGHWLGLRLRGTRPASTPVGARVTCKVAGRETVRWLTSGTSYLSSNDPRLWFGLGSARAVDQLEVRWPSGELQSWSDVAADHIFEIREGDPLMSTTTGGNRERAGNDGEK
jgi:tetratricopeptide (TPR) repeat protein